MAGKARVRARSILPVPNREAFSALMRRARFNVGLSYNQVADAATPILNDHRASQPVEVILWSWIQWLENEPALPLTCTEKLGAVLEVYGVTWRETLETLGCRRICECQNMPRRGATA